MTRWPGPISPQAVAADDLVAAPFAAAAFAVDLRDLLFRFVISGSPEKPKGPGEGAPVAGLKDSLGNQRRQTMGFPRTSSILVRNTVQLQSARCRRKNYIEKSV